MKKLFIGLLALILVLGIGTAVYASTSGNINNGTFEQMLPTMKQMHPDLTDQQRQDMFITCQTNSGTGMQQMMNHSQHHGSMMN